MLTTKIEKKIGKFIDKYPLCFIFVRDYGVKSKEEFPALCTLAVKSRLIFTGSISEILVE